MNDFKTNTISEASRNKSAPTNARLHIRITHIVSIDGVPASSIYPPSSFFTNKSISVLGICSESFPPLIHRKHTRFIYIYIVHTLILSNVVSMEVHRFTIDCSLHTCRDSTCQNVVVSSYD